MFRRLRAAWGINDAEYMLSLGGSQALRQLNSPGKSGVCVCVCVWPGVGGCAGRPAGVMRPQTTDVWLARGMGAIGKGGLVRKSP